MDIFGASPESRMVFEAGNNYRWTMHYVIYRTDTVAPCGAVLGNGPCQTFKMKPLAALNHYRLPQNALLAALPAADHQDLTPHLERVPLTPGQILYDTGQTISHAYFPLNCSVSLHYVMENGDAAEIAIIGNEGVVGISLFMGGESTQSRVVVQNGGYAYRLLTSQKYRRHLDV